MTYITLEYNGTEKSLADWGFEQQTARAETLNLRPNTLDLFLPGATYASAPIIPFEGKVILRVNRGRHVSGAYTGGAIDFVGWRLDFTLDDEAGNPGVNYRFVGGWYILESMMFQQPTATYNGTVGLQNQTGLLLFSKISEGHSVDARETVGQLPNFLIAIDNGWQIEQILKFAIAQETARTGSPPFQVGQIDCNVAKPYYPAQELSCAAAIELCLDLSPDCTVIWDDATTPPTVHVKKKSNLTPVTLAIANGVDHQKLKITPLETLVPRSVVIIYRINNTTDGSNWVQFVKDKYGPNGANSPLDPDAGLRVLLQTIDLQGSQTTTVSENDVRVIPMNANYGTGATGNGDVERRAWWGKFHREFLGTDHRFQRAAFNADGTLNLSGFIALAIADATIKENTGAADGAAVSLATYPNFLTKGAIRPWMKLADGTPVVAKHVSIETEVAYCVWDRAASGGDPDAATNGVFLRQVKKQKLTVSGTLTNAQSGDYSTMASYVGGEVVPSGIAQALYQALAAKQYEGVRIGVEEMISQQVSMFNTLNLSGGHADWATMNAQIQGIQRLYGSGQTFVTIGPARHLRGGDLNQIFQFNRYRFIWQNPLVRENAQAGNGGSNIEL